MAFTPKKIYSSNTPGQAPSSGTELAKNFNDNFDAVKSDLDEKDKKIVQLEQDSNKKATQISINTWTTGFLDKTKNKTDPPYTTAGFKFAFIPVSVGSVYNVETKLGGATMAAVIFYNSVGLNLGYLVKGDNLEHDFNFTIPENVAEIAIQGTESYKVSLYTLTDGLTKQVLDLYKDVASKTDKVDTDTLKISVDENKREISSIDSLFEVSSKNQFEGIFVNGYIDSNGNFKSDSTGKYLIGRMAVQSNTFYCISNRKVGSTSNIRCVDENLQNPTKVRVAATGAEYTTWYTPKSDGSGVAINGNSQIKTSPTAAYIEFNIAFNVTSDIDSYKNIMIELVGEMYNPDFTPSAYQPFEGSKKLKQSALPNSQQSSKVISLRTTPTFLLVGASHGEGYGSVKDKAFISYLSNFLSWNVENYSKTGSDYIEHYNMIQQGVKIGGIHPYDLNGGIALIILGGNEAAYYTNGVDAKFFRLNIIRLCTLLESYGFTPMLGSYYGDMDTPWSLVVRSVARDKGYLFIDMNAIGSHYYKNLYRPWWYNAHYATRTNAQQWHPILSMLSELNKPNSAIKIYRNRNSYSSIDNLLFDNNYEKMKLWRELSLKHCPLKTEYIKYVDRLDKTRYTDLHGQSVSLPAINSIDSEYNNFRLGNPITVSDSALVQITLPVTNGDTFINIECDEVLDVYFRKYIDVSQEISLIGSSATFFPTGSPSIVVGDTYSDSNNIAIVFTVISYKNGVITASANGSFTSVGNTLGTLTRLSGSGSASVEYNKAQTAPSGAYFDAISKTTGKWIKTSIVNGKCKLPSGCLNYDTCEMLIKKAVLGSFFLKNIAVEYTGDAIKNSELTTKLKALSYKSNSEGQILPKTTFENPTVDWSMNVSDGMVWNGVVTYIDPNGNQTTGEHIPVYYSTQKSVSKILRLNSGKSIKQSTPILGEKYSACSYRFKIVARYYPTEALDIDNLPVDVRTSSTFDFGRFDVRINLTGTESYYTKTYYAPLSFVEIEDELFFDATTGLKNEITITAVDDNVEFLLCEIIKE